MDADTLEALKASIRKWRKNVSATLPEDVRCGVSNCPLCIKFFYDDCFGCPIAKATGIPGCRNTPYETAIQSQIDWHYDAGQRAKFVKCAQAEVAFLESLLPEGEAA